MYGRDRGIDQYSLSISFGLIFIAGRLAMDGVFAAAAAENKKQEHLSLIDHSSTGAEQRACNPHDDDNISQPA